MRVLGGFAGVRWQGMGQAVLGTKSIWHAEKGAEKLPSETKGVPQGLKPRCKQSASGTHSAPLRAGSEAVPLSKTDFSATGGCS
jgi:hypothetical protein